MEIDNRSLLKGCLYCESLGISLTVGGMVLVGFDIGAGVLVFVL